MSSVLIKRGKLDTETDTQTRTMPCEDQRYGTKATELLPEAGTETWEQILPQCHQRE